MWTSKNYRQEEEQPWIIEEAFKVCKEKGKEKKRGGGERLPSIKRE